MDEAKIIAEHFNQQRYRGNGVFRMQEQRCPLKLGRLPYSCTGVWRELQRAAEDAGIGHLGTHAFRHTYRSWLDAVGTPIAVQQKLMRHSDIRTTMNIYGDVVTDEMETAAAKVAALATKAA